MALPDFLRTQLGTPVVWADTTDYASGASDLARTHQITLSALADAGARQGAKADLGSAPAGRYMVYVGIEFDVAPASGEVVEFYLGESPTSVAANANPGGLSGSDAAYTGTAGDSLADSVKQLTFVGNLICTADAATTVQYQKVGVVEPTMRWVMPVVKNEGGQAFEGDDVEMFYALIPVEGVVADT